MLEPGLFRGPTTLAVVKKAVDASFQQTPKEKLSKSEPRYSKEDRRSHTSGRGFLPFRTNTTEAELKTLETPRVQPLCSRPGAYLALLAHAQALLRRTRDIVLQQLRLPPTPITAFVYSATLQMLVPKSASWILSGSKCFLTKLSYCASGLR